MGSPWESAGLPTVVVDRDDEAHGMSSREGLLFLWNAGRVHSNIWRTTVETSPCLPVQNALGHTC